MRPSAMMILSVAMLARAALAVSPAFAGDMLEPSGGEAGAGTQKSETRKAQRGQSSRPLPEVVANWLVAEFDLSTHTPPRIKFVRITQAGAMSLPFTMMMRT